MAKSGMTVESFQHTIKNLYFEKDSNRGLEGTFVWFVEEVGELARAIQTKDRAELEEEFADVFAWLASLANLSEVDLETTATKYRNGCPKCEKAPCKCDN